MEAGIGNWQSAIGAGSGTGISRIASLFARPNAQVRLSDADCDSRFPVPGSRFPIGKGAP